MANAKQKIKLHPLQGAKINVLIKLIIQNFRYISYKKTLKLLLCVLTSIVIAPIHFFEKIKYNKKIKQTKIIEDPVFILGFWRSGTTYLHRIFSYDKKKNHFFPLITLANGVYITLKKPLTVLLKKYLPKKRQMDSLRVSINQAAEDAFAFACSTCLSVNHSISFPRNIQRYYNTIFYNNLSEKQKKEVKKKYSYMVKKLAYSTNDNQIVIKSPENTAKINMLLELYPNAKFVFISRCPYTVFSSIQGLLKTLIKNLSMQDLSFMDDDYIIDNFVSFYSNFHKEYLKTKHLIKHENLIEIKYEDYTKDAKTYIKKIYDYLGLEGYEQAKDNIEAYIDKLKDYKNNEFNIDEKAQKKINDKLAFYFEEFGYDIIPTT